MLDAFSVDLEPNYDFDPTYANHDVAFIKEQMDLHPDCKNVYLVSHYFDYRNESAEFKDLIKNDTRIKGLFQGHTHTNKIIDMGAEYNNKRICETGNYSQLGPDATKAELTQYFWGFRELIITPEAAITRYIKPTNKIQIAGQVFMDMKRNMSAAYSFY